MNLLEIKYNWKAPVVSGDIPHGDMPGDKIEIREEHIQKATKIFPELLEQLLPVFEAEESPRAVITVCGGSGVGKSEIASLLSWYFTQAGIGSYTLSGDNYPHRIPQYNDAERLRIFREKGLRAMTVKNLLDPERMEQIRKWEPMQILHMEKYITGIRHICGEDVKDWQNTSVLHEKLIFRKWKRLYVSLRRVLRISGLDVWEEQTRIFGMRKRIFPMYRY